MGSRYAAPFASGGPQPIDAEIARKLLEIALSKGGGYADLFFEYAASGSYSFDEGILKSAGRAVAMGLGVRVMKGDATGYAYVEDLDFEAMARAARTAANIAAGAQGRVAPQFVAPRSAQRYGVSQISLDVPGPEKRALLERADRRARAADARVVRVDASLSEEIRELLIASSDGRFVFDRQPLLRLVVRVIEEQ
jgi:TldD protein